MAGWDSALTTWSGWVITGLTLWDIDEILPRVPSVLLPVMYLQQSAGRGEGQKSRGFTTPQADNVMYLQGTGLVAPIAHNIYGQTHRTAQGLLDSYLTKAAGDPDLGGALSVPMRLMDPVVRVVQHNLVYYVGFTVLHRWEATE